MTLQQTPEKRPKKIDLNLLPKEYLPPKKSKLTVSLFLVIVLLICALTPIVIFKSGVESDIKPLDAKLSQLDTILKEHTANNKEAADIQAQIDSVNSQLATMEFSYATFIKTRLIWSEILSEIDDLTTARITVSSLSLSKISITISGTATKRQYILDYATAFEGSSFFKNVDLGFGDNPEGTQITFTITAPLDLESIGNNSSN